ncbi:hypothetical protein [Thiolapillus sp.]
MTMEKVPLLKIMKETFAAPLSNLQLFSQALAVPILLLVCVWGAWIAVSPSRLAISLLFYLLYFAFFSYMVIICHQLILNDKATLHDILLPNISILIRFMILMAVVYLITTIIEYVIITLYINSFDSVIIGKLTDEALAQQQNNMSHDLEVAKYIAYILSMYIFGRLCLVFPATALGYKPSLKWSWIATKNYHFQIFIIVAVFPWILKLFLYAIYRENATLVEQVLIALLMYISAALGVFAISLTYKELYRIENSKL